MKPLKIPIYIILSLALVWLGGAWLAFATCSDSNLMPACPCNHNHGESTCCCDSHTSQKSAPACSVKQMPMSSCACNYNRSDSSPATTVTVYRIANPAIVNNPTISASDAASNTVNQTFPALPSTSLPFTPLRI